MAGRRSRKVPGLSAEFTSALEQMSPEQLRTTLAQVLDLAADPPSPGTRVGGSRSVEQCLTIRLELLEGKPPVWRRVEVPSVLSLGQLHGVVQALFGWTDSHLHRFALGESVWDAGEVYVGPAELEEADGDQVLVLDRTVRLDEVLSEPGDALRYVYDYGDNWELLLTVEQAGQLSVSAPNTSVSPGGGPAAQQVRLLDGRGLAPPEDVGGTWAWNEGRSDAPLDRAAVEEALRVWRSEQGLPPELVVLLEQVAGSAAERQLRDLIDAAGLQQDMTEPWAPGPAGGETEVSAEQARALVGRFLWLLGKVGDGVTLTAAGWLPPSLVTEAMNGLWPPGSWIGKANREDITEPVRRLRATAQRLGLIRVLKGRLLLTRAGAALREDPVGLWAYIADRAVGKPRDEITRLASLLRLLELAAAADRDGPSRARVAGILSAAGWRAADGGPVSPFTVGALTPQLDELLDCLSTPRRRGSGTQGLEVFARHALRRQTWQT